MEKFTQDLNSLQAGLSSTAAQYVNWNSRVMLQWENIDAGSHENFVLEQILIKLDGVR